MPKIKRVTGEIGTTGDTGTVSIRYTSERHPRPNRFGATDWRMVGARQALAEAIELEHHCASDNTCDIRYSADAGYVFWSARLLSGATETPLLDLTMKALFFNGVDIKSEIDRDLEQWCEESKSARKCEACESYVYDPEASHCDNCRSELPATDEEQESEA